LLLCAEHGISIDPVVVDLMTGQHHQEPFITLNPGKRVPVLEDGAFVLTEGSAILKYLAALHAPDVYPEDPKKRARINSRMDWFNTGFYMDFGYNFVYPQVLPHVQHEDATVQAATIARGLEQSKEWLRLLDSVVLGENNSYVCGDDLSIADYLGASYLTLGFLIGVDFGDYPNICRWLAKMKALPSWRGVHEAFGGWTASMEGRSFTTLR